MKRMDSKGSIGSLYDVAVVGMAGRFPGADDLKRFWENLRDGVESVTFFSDEKLLQAGVPSHWLRAPAYVKANAAVSDVECFDARFFGISPREAEMMDPQHRVFLECAWSVLDSAGYNSEQYDGCIGVYAGTSMNTYFLNNLYTGRERIGTGGSFQAMIGNDKDFLATQVSYRLNLQGPSFTVQTACSTSLVAVHLACQALLNRECDMALAGGVSLMSPQIVGYFYEEEGIFSPDGHCRPFDAEAQGTIGGSGVGIVALKRLADALEDGDTIHAVIKSSAINNDGARKVGYTAPSEDGQVEVIAEALAVADVAPETITYVEAHGTGTALGDPVEVAALTRAFRADTDAKGFCALGSVKSNIGHLDAAAGVAGLIKTILALKHKQLPPSLNFTAPNPRIDFANSPFYVNAKLQDWKTNGQPRRAGVSSFGIGGTNVHVILEEAPPPQPTDLGASEHVLVLSAKSGEALEKATAGLAAHLRQHPEANLADVAHTLQVGRRSFAHRRMLVCRDVADTAAALEAVDPQRVFTAYEEPRRRPLFFMFPGQGAQYVNMGRGLYESEPLFREALDNCAALLEPSLGFDLLDVLYPDADGENAATERLEQTMVTQPALFAVEYAMTRLWQAWGLQPDGMIGHSIGEYVAACLAGVFTLEEALALVVQRGRLIQQLPGGSMLSVSMGEAEVRPFLSSSLSLAAVNSPGFCTVSGPDEAIKALQAQLELDDISCRRLNTSHAFHSAMIEPILDEFAACVGRTTLNPPRIPFVSNVTGTWITADEATDPHYWAKHMRQTVRLADGLRVLLSVQDQVLLEVGPGQTLHTLARQQQAQTAFVSLRHPRNNEADRPFLLTTLGRLWLSGLDIDWRTLYSDEHRRRIPLPAYPFARDRYWVDPHPLSPARTDPARSLDKRPNPDEWFYMPCWKPSPVPVSAAEPTTWVVFAEDDVLGTELAARLRTMGHTVNAVRAGAQFSAPGTNGTDGYTVAPQQPEDYDRLLAVLIPAPRRIVYCATGAFGFYGLLFLTQALGRQNWGDVRLDIITHAAQQAAVGDSVDPARALVLGLALVIPQEYPGVTCRVVDVAAVSYPWQAARQHDHLFAEVTTESSEMMVAYRGGQRWVQAFEMVRPPGDGVSRLREEGVYLITGGLGRIGRVFASYLAETLRAKMVLISRTGLPPQAEWADWLTTSDPADPTSDKVRFVQALEAKGAEVLVCAADVADRDQMQAVLTQTYQRFGTLHGVLHAAGTVGSDMTVTIQETTRDHCEAQFHSKMQGTQVLAEVLGDRELDFCVLFSSLATVLGGLGLAAYAAANCFMDAFARQHNQTHPTPWLSVNWDGWRFSGESLGSELGASALRLSLSPDEGVRALTRALCLGTAPQVVISTGDLQARLDLWVTRQTAAQRAETPETPAAGQYARPDLQTTYVAPQNEMEEKVAAIWQEILGISDVGVHDNFFELGGHSLLLVHMHTSLQKAFDRVIPIAQLFQYPTIRDLAKHLSEMPEKEPALVDIDERGDRYLETKKRRRRQLAANNFRVED
jgi:acyl transferase domain-containing protein/acyl carrier protein